MPVRSFQRFLCIALGGCVLLNISSALNAQQADNPGLVIIALGAAVFAGWVAWFTWPKR